MNPAKVSKNSKYKQGYYDARRSTKYRGPSLLIPYRSSYEYRFILYCENNPNVVEWSYETLKIPYKDPTGKLHNYYMDFIVKYKNGSTYLIEVKPYTQTLPQRNAAYRKNSLKWEAAKNYANERGFTFMIVTEKSLERMKF